jgi:hypothetical protein
LFALTINNETLEKLALIVAEKSTPGCNVEEVSEQVLNDYQNALVHLNKLSPAVPYYSK